VKGGHRRSRGDRNPMSLKRPWGARRRARLQEEEAPEERPAGPYMDYPVASHLDPDDPQRDGLFGPPAPGALDGEYEPDRLNPLWPAGEWP